MKKVCLLPVLLLLINCYQPRRDCTSFKTGTFSFTTELEGAEITTRFRRTEDLEISEFKGVVDSASVRWINDCEYILTNLNPKSRNEEKPIHMKILSTTDNSYIFEYKLVGSTKTSRGTAIKTN
ncbi:DNA topoisomerase IV [Robiginitalea sp. IMCC44478]|uniref:DNA topoisomerase IV n=1 Tax=Robiginitalea sp. IMCC44478 TaxID=3459122 RepID=UPI004041F469